MMTKETYNLEFITPCFCSGADQGKAEIRSASIRGELRWWFRILGGSPEQELEVFGGVHGGASASKVVVRVKMLSEYHDEQSLPGRRLGQPLFYLGYFASVSGEKKGQRFEKEGFFSPGTRFELQLIRRDALGMEEARLLQEAIRVFVALGGLGMRVTRGFGAWTCGESPTLEQFEFFAKQVPGVDVWSLRVSDSPRKAHIQLETALRDFRKLKHFSGKTTTPVGGASPRQKSTIHLRPVKVVEGFLPVVFYSERPLTDGMRGIRRELQEFFAGR